MDAFYEKILYDNRVINMAVQVVIGIDEDGKWDILAVQPMQDESEATYKELFEQLSANLRRRGVMIIAGVPRRL